MSRTCPQCFSADDVTQVRGVDSLWTFTCSNVGGHEPRGDVIWDATNEAEGTGEDVRRSLSPYMGPLRSCVLEGEPYVEYGVVEWRFRLLAPALFAELIREHGHRMLNKMDTPKTTSAYLAQALGLLAAEGSLARVYAKATGAWGYLGQVTYWAAPPAPPTTSTLSWEDYARDQGLDASDASGVFLRRG